jgi:hypothetical protein
MVEYAVLLAHNTSEIVGMTASDISAWLAGLNWARIGTAALALASVRVVIWAFGGR